MPVIDELLQANRHYTKRFHPDTLTARPTRGLAILTCMDARLDLFRFLGLEIGDSHILRNAGGRATDDAIRSLVVSSHTLGTREFGVIHHTGCGLEGVDNAALQAELGTDIDFLPFDDLEASVRADVERIEACELLPAGRVVWGAVYDVHTGKLEVVSR